MIIRHKHRGKFTTIPNAIFSDERLSFAARGVLAYLLSLPPNWEVRHDQLRRKLGVGRKILARALHELIEARYVTRDASQKRDEFNRFITLNYVVSDIPSAGASDAPFPARPEPRRKGDSGNNNKVIKTDSTNIFSKSPRAGQGAREGAQQEIYTEFGQRALAAGNSPVFLGSRPYHAWSAFRGSAEAMPGFVDRMQINNKVKEIVWMPSVYPPKRSADPDGGGG